MSCLDTNLGQNYRVNKKLNINLESFFNLSISYIHICHMST